MVYRIYVEKKEGFRQEANALLEDVRSFLGIQSIRGLRVLNRYDVEGISPALMERCKTTVFSEPQVDDYYENIPAGAQAVLAVEYLPGQFDQRADSAAQCIQLISQGERPLVRTARVYLLYGELCPEEIGAIRSHVINPVESREASLEPVDTLCMQVDPPQSVPAITGFIHWDAQQLEQAVEEYGLAMDAQDIACCQAYFRDEAHRDPTLAELRMLDTYWSDHCRHTTFLTALENVQLKDPAVAAAYERYLRLRQELGREDKPITLMDLATIGARYLRHTGQSTDEDQSPEINACTIKIEVDVNGKPEPWLLLFKNETHNHPTEIEPFGGAATCIGGAIRDPLSGRAYVYQAMRVTGAANPLTPLQQTIPGKLPQRKLTTTAAAGYSAYGNQIGLATGLVDEIYHPGYAAKRMEIGAVIGAAPAKNVRREEPVPGDVVVLLGGKTGRDGCGGATGSSKSHKRDSLTQCGAEVQKGNAPEERKLQRLMRNPEATRKIKRCNDFGAGGVSVAIGELADGLQIDLDAVPKKYEGLDGVELAISESQERMAVVLAPEDVPAFLDLAASENLEATVVARVTEEPRLVMKWNGQTIVDISRAFIDTNGAQKKAEAVVDTAAEKYEAAPKKKSFSQTLTDLAEDLNVCAKRGLVERFDSTIGAGTVLMPYGGYRQRTPAQAMVAKLPVLYGETSSCSAMAWGYNPFVSEKNPYRGAYLAVVESVAKLVASGAGLAHCHLTFQEYFQRLGNDPLAWGKPLAALLGALDAQLALGLGAIGGKDSMSGTFEQMHVPPTLVSFAVSVGHTGYIISPEFKRPGSTVVWLQPQTDANGLPTGESLKALFFQVNGLIQEGKVLSAYTPGHGGIAAGVMKMALGNRVGFAFDPVYHGEGLVSPLYGGFVLELSEPLSIGVKLGETIGEYVIEKDGERVSLETLETAMEQKLECVFPTCAGTQGDCLPCDYRAERRVTPGRKIAAPRVLIPVFPGTNCEYDTAHAFLRAGAVPQILVVDNQSAAGVATSVQRFANALAQSQILAIPGGFSGGDEPDGSGKFITAFLRNPAIQEQVQALLEQRDGLMLGVCNGFQALIKLGLVPYGCIREQEESAPTLTFNAIGRHQSRLAYTRVASNRSPWLMYANVGEVHCMPISHGEGRFVCDRALLEMLGKNGQIAAQYCDRLGRVSMEIDINPNGSVSAVEAITSPDGRVLGKMGHSERYGKDLYKNVPGQDDSMIFQGAVDYFRL